MLVELIEGLQKNPLSDFALIGRVRQGGDALLKAIDDSKAEIPETLRQPVISAKTFVENSKNAENNQGGYW